MAMTREEKDANWNNFINNLFPDGVPQTKIWTNLREIADQLNKIGFDNSRAYNHMFLPRGGGLDLSSAQLSNLEPGTIELNLGSLIYVVKPSKLYFHSFDSDPEWFYFRLETGILEPSGVYENPFFSDFEEVCRLPDGQLIERDYFDIGYYGLDENGREKPLPRGSRGIIRQFEGSFVLFGKFSRYNMTSSTYDGRHNQMTNEEFRTHIQEVIDYLKNR